MEWMDISDKSAACIRNEPAVRAYRDPEKSRRQGEHMRLILAFSSVRLCTLLCILTLVLLSPDRPAFSSIEMPFPETGSETHTVHFPISSAEARVRIAALRGEIAHHDALYFKHAAPVISDFAYDQLKHELAVLEKAFPGPAEEASPVSPMGDDRTGLFPTRRHLERMLSLDKTYTESGLRTFHARLARLIGREDLAYVVEPKVDGLAVSATYEKGTLVRAVTRGDGDEGDDITANARSIRSFPLVLRPDAPDGSQNPIPDLIELRGEIYLPLAELDRLNREREAAGEAMFASSRNLAAGTVRQRDARMVAERGLEVVFYGWGACKPATMSPETQGGFHAQARAWGLPAFEKTWTAHGPDEIWGAVRAFDRMRRELPFATDGLVVKLDSVAFRRGAGLTNRSPRWAMAYKFTPERAETEILAITLQVGRTGVLTPVAELAPVQIDGAAVARATLHNRETISRLDLRIGDFVYVERVGGTIPAISGVNVARRTPGSRPFSFPEACPACGAAVVQSTGGIGLHCPNFECPAQVRRRIEHFASRACVGIDGLGAATIDALFGNGRLKNIADLYRLRREDLLALGKDVARSADNLLAAIERSKRAELWRFIHGLGIPHVGAATARDLAARFGCLDALAAAGYEDFIEGGGSAVSGVGEATARAILLYFNEARNRTVVESLAASGVRPTAPPPSIRRIPAEEKF
jgi:DNA ligase (NAD+)